MLKALLVRMAVIAVIGALVSAEGGAVTVDLETGVAGAGYNDVQVPGNRGTRFSLTDDFSTGSTAFYRVRLTEKILQHSFISFLYAPLSLEAHGVTKTPLNFNNDTFPANTAVAGKYRFDSYRLSYWKNFAQSDRLTLKLGFTAKIRDAAISISGNGITSEKKNTGFVPLLNFGFTCSLNDKFSVILDADALAGGPGRAEDVLLAGEFKTGARSGIKAGCRIVEGGADTDEVYNFALLTYLVLGFIYSF